ncbi:MAG: hypothetical protein JO257_27510 [Deltaproteobacteria bacterium]|nr:hypothetical protein [Deltaproteobacteria bacterium]
MRRLLVLALIAGCSSKKETPPDPPIEAKPERPLRDAVGDADLRALVYDYLSTQACQQALHRMSGIKDRTREGIVNGQIWVRSCKVTNEGSRLSAELSGNGWQWQHVVQKKGGGTFEVNQYVKFAVTAKLAGTVDLAYSPKNHVASLWFTPSGPADVDVKPVGEIAVDRDDTWSSIIGGVGSLVGESPEDNADDTAKKKGKQAFQEQIARGFAVGIDLCTHTVRMSLQRLPKGVMPKATVGETHKVEVEVQNGGVVMYGPYRADVGMTIDVDVTGGPAKVSLGCQAEAEQTAQAFLDEKPGAAQPIKTEVITGHAVLHAPRERCPLYVVMRSVQPAPVQVSFVRPTREAMEASGGPFAECARDKPLGGEPKATPGTPKTGSGDDEER